MLKKKQNNAANLHVWDPLATPPFFLATQHQTHLLLLDGRKMEKICPHSTVSAVIEGVMTFLFVPMALGSFCQDEVLKTWGFTVGP